MVEDGSGAGGAKDCPAAAQRLAAALLCRVLSDRLVKQTLDVGHCTTGHCDVSD